MLCQHDGQGQPPLVVSAWGLRAPRVLTPRPLEGGPVGRALTLQRAAFEPLHPGLDASFAESNERPDSTLLAGEAR